MRKDWLNNIKDLPIEQQDRIIADIVRYGTEMELAHKDDVLVGSIVNMVKGAIDTSKQAYMQKVVMSKTAGRKKRIDDEAIWGLAREGKSSGEIAEILGYSKSAVDHSQGWKNRKTTL